MSVLTGSAGFWSLRATRNARCRCPPGSKGFFLYRCAPGPMIFPPPSPIPNPHKLSTGRNGSRFAPFKMVYIPLKSSWRDLSHCTLRISKFLQSPTVFKEKPSKYRRNPKQKSRISRSVFWSTMNEILSVWDEKNTRM